MSLTFLEHLGAATDVSGVQITAHASANTVGTATNIGGTSAAECAAIEIQLSQPRQNVSYLVSIGADGVFDFVNNILVNCANSATSPAAVIVSTGILPMVFAAGTQFSAKCQASTGGSTVDVSIALYTGTTAYTLAFVESIGANTTTSRGVQLDPGATGTTKGAWAELVASLSGDCDFLVPIIQPDSGQSVINAARIWVDIGQGTGGSEAVKAGDIYVREDPLESRTVMGGAREVGLTSGQRIAARAQSTSTNVGRREMDCVILGYKLTAAGGGATIYPRGANTLTRM